MERANLGDRVRIEYTKLHKHGADTPEPRVPQVLEFTAGSDDIIPCVSLGVVGMSPGEHKELSFETQDAGSMVSAGLEKQKPRPPAPPFDLRVGEPRIAGRVATGRRPRLRVVGVESQPSVIEFEITLISFDASSNANRRKPQFEVGGEA